MEVNQHLNGSLAALADDMEDHPAGSPTSQVVEHCMVE